jgi:hypothetical protein
MLCVCTNFTMHIYIGYMCEFYKYNFNNSANIIGSSCFHRPHLKWVSNTRGARNAALRNWRLAECECMLWFLPATSFTWNENSFLLADALLVLVWPVSGFMASWLLQWYCEHNLLSPWCHRKTQHLGLAPISSDGNVKT